MEEYKCTSRTYRIEQLTNKNGIKPLQPPADDTNSKDWNLFSTTIVVSEYTGPGFFNDIKATILLLTWTWVREV